MIAAGGADVAQYFGFAINLAQQIAYLFGEDELFDGGGQLSEAAQIRVIAYLGAMFGAAGAAALVSQTSKRAGANLGKKVAAQALTKTAWYPLVKKGRGTGRAEDHQEDRREDDHQGCSHRRRRHLRWPDVRDIPPDGAPLG